ncbi:MAG TPA: dihydroorotase [Candidatus Margulisiibacteriota bacterium]|nr:dihydroorotase [Candidatus Margulisiibacteriota bacterium]
MKMLIRGGRVIDPANKLDRICDILIEEGRISKVEKDIKADAALIDASGKIVAPGLVDMHVHLREPGREDKETVLSGTTAASAGGVTSLLAMPNTCPAIDSAENVVLLKSILKKDAQVNVYIAGAITRGRKGEELTDILHLKKEGILAISDDGSSVDREDLMLEALKEACQAHLLVISHCEDKSLSSNGVVNLGFTSTRMGLKGISKESEYKRVERDISLAEKAGYALHIAHVSCRESVEIIARAKKRGIKVTAETCPHYFALSEEAVLGYDPNKKMNPPLRSKEDALSLKEGLKNGVIDAIASDHAPHTENEKEIEFERAEFGVIGLETLLAVGVTELVSPGFLDWRALIEKVSYRPAEILGIERGSLTPGSVADIVIFDPALNWQVEKLKLVSKSKNSPFLGSALKGRVEYTICSGKIVYKA